MGGAVISVVPFVGFPIMVGVLMLGIATFIWVMLWVCLFWLVYIEAFLPWLGYFPITGISLLEMDQVSAFLGVLVIAALRTLHPILKTLNREGAEGGYELTPLLADRAPAPVSEPGLSNVSPNTAGVDAREIGRLRLE
jgi:hypothetical protein